MNRTKLPKTLTITAALFCFMVLLVTVPGCTAPVSNTGSGGVPNETITPTPTPASTDISFGDTFVFDNLEITFINETEWVILDNEFDENHGADVLRIPMTVKNISEETYGLDSASYTIYGPKGTQLDLVNFYFDNNVSDAGDMRSGAVQDTNMYVLYDGDGDYYIEFEELFTLAETKVEVKLPIAK